MQKKASIAAFLIFIYTLTPAIGAQRGVSSIDLSASPSHLPADGKSICTISAEVWAKNGDHVPDGTEVTFTSSIGVIEGSATTSGGFARARLVSASIPGVCVVTATWSDGPAVSHMNVSFGQGAENGKRYISVKAADYLAYSVDLKTLEAIGNVKIQYKGIEIEAREAQINTDTGRLVARGGGATPVRLHSPNGVIEGDILTINVQDLSGLVISSSKGAVQRIDFAKPTPVLTADSATYAPEDFDFADLSSSSILIKAKAATIFMNDRILFKSTKMYVDGKKMLSLPYYSLSLTGYQSEDEQYVGYSTGGVTLNLPFYYALTPSFEGSVHIRHGDKAGWGQFGQTPGWFVDLQQKYETANSSGTVVFNRATDQDWGANITHTQKLGATTRAFLYIQSPDHRDLYSALNLNHSLPGSELALGLYRNHSRLGNDTFNTDLSLQTHSKPVAKGSILNFNLSARTDYANIGSIVTNNVQGNLFTNSVPLSKVLSLRSSLGLGYLWGDPNNSGLTTLGTTALNWKISKLNNFSLNYRYADRASVLTSTQTGKQTLSANMLFTDGKKWHASIYGIKGIDYRSLNVFGDFDYRLSSQWRLGLSTTNNVDRSNRRYSDMEITLGKAIGNRELLAAWSQSQRKIMIELGSGGF